MQHEYGIFGANAGEKILQLLGRLEKPLITTLHTVLAAPDANQRRVMGRILATSEKAIVMIEKGRTLLRSVHDVPQGKVAVVPHGAPNRPLRDTAAFNRVSALAAAKCC